MGSPNITHGTQVTHSYNKRMSYNESSNHLEMDIDEITEDQNKTNIAYENNHRLIKVLTLNSNEFSNDNLNSIINESFNNKTNDYDRRSEILYSSHIHTYLPLAAIRSTVFPKQEIVHFSQF